MAGEDLLRALQGTQYSVADNPFAIAGQGIAQFSPSLQNPYASTGSNLGHAVGAGLLAALLGGIGSNQTASRNAELAPLRAQMFGATPEERIGLVRQNPMLAPLNTYLEMDEFGRKRDLQYEIAKQQNALPGDLLKNMLITQQGMLADQGYLMGPDGDLQQITDPIAFEAEKAARVKLAQENANPVPGLPGVPENLKDEALIEKGELQKLAQADKSIEQIFANVSDVGGLGAAIPGGGTQDAKQLQYAQSRIEQIINNITGREASDPAVQRVIAGAAPSWNDTDEDRNRKQMELKQGIRDLMKPTPVLDAYGLNGSKVANIVVGPDGQQYEIVD